MIVTTGELVGTSDGCGVTGALDGCGEEQISSYSQVRVPKTALQHLTRDS
jgi:hypothetical protein